jgi:SPP1 gp7 family putative phage head morphogenesis protein
MPKQQHPIALAAGYARSLHAIVQFSRHLLGPLFSELPHLLLQSERELARMDKGESKRVSELVDQAVEEMRREKLGTARLEALAVRIAGAVSIFQRAQLARQIRAALGIDLTFRDARLAQRIEAFAHENAALITDMSEGYMREVAKAATRAVTEGTRWETLSEQLQGRLDIAENRADLIARDQVGKLYGQINADRQQEVGIEKFVWRTVQDERVRPEHDDRDGGVYSYDDPPDGELPGEPINCRCNADPYLEDLQVALRSEE